MKTKTYKCIIILIVIAVIVIAILAWSKTAVIETYEPKVITLPGDTEKLCHRNTESCEFPLFEHPCCVSNGIDMLRDVTTSFKKHGVDLWIAYGTLLGHLRHGGFIPWDNDIDTLTEATSAATIENKIKPELEAMGYVVKRHSGKADAPTNPDFDYYTVNYSKYNSLHLDVGLCEEIDLLQGPSLSTNLRFDSRALVDAPPSSKSLLRNDPVKFKSWIHPLRYTFPLRNAKLYGVDVLVPFDSENLVKGIYSEDCLTKAKIKKTDSAGINENLGDHHVTTFLPAQPLKLWTNRTTPNLGVKQCYVINLKSRKDRLAHTMAQLDLMRLPGKAVEAVDARNVDIDELKRLGIYEPDPKYGEMSRNTIACDLSHHKALMMVARSGPDDAPSIILEDDIIFQPDARNVLERLEIDRTKLRWDVIMLGSTLVNDDEILPTTVPYLFKTGMLTGTWAYMVTPVSARKILSSIYPFSNPIDTVITVPSVEFDTSRKHIDDKIARHDRRFIGNLDKLAVYTGRMLTTGVAGKIPNRIGIINELSTGWNDSSSTPPSR
jgi:lipopolysaccharide cholinephosphotransferase